MKIMQVRLTLATAAAALLTLPGAAASPLAERLAERSASVDLEALDRISLRSPIRRDGTEFARMAAELRDTSGPQTVSIRLREPSVGKAKKLNPGLDTKAHKAKVIQQQNKFVARSAGLKVIAKTQMVFNGVFAEVDAQDLAALAADPDVLSIKKVRDYELDLTTTVPHIGADLVQGIGVDGTGVTVAVLDSGIDYTHVAMGGPGTLADYILAYGTDVAPLGADDRHTTRDGLFPTAKVVEGIDFVGEDWPFGPLAPDDDPIPSNDLLSNGGHGTHVADIIGGVTGGAPGVAPGVSFHAVRVCASYATSCSGIALIQGMGYAVDPNRDGDTSDHVDIVNMSLGSNYGQPFDDDLVLAVNNATSIGVLTVASAGNSSDKPYITGTPAAAATALSVAQTSMPNASLQLIDVDGVSYPAVFQSWSGALAATIGPVTVLFGGAFGSANGCSTDPDDSESELAADRPFAPGTFSGEIVLVDRGACSFTAKIRNIEFGGGALGIIGLVAPGDPFAGGFGGGTAPTIPGFMISQANSTAIKGQIGGPGIGTVDPSNTLPLVGTLVGSSSRGPRNPDSVMKPEIGAPGASVSAASGTGDGVTGFGGTSGAAPMVAGAAALLMEAHPGGDPAHYKARLMNNAETDVDTDAFAGLAPLSRIGGGEVRVDRAVDAPVTAQDAATGNGALTLGFFDTDKDVMTVQRQVRLTNHSDSKVTYTITPTFRFANDEASGAFEVKVQKKASVKAGRSVIVPVTFKVRGANLPDNAMNAGSDGANPAPLTLNEYDGFLNFDDGSHPIHMAWHSLPRKASNVVGRPVLNFDGGLDFIDLTNNGVGTAQNDAYSLLAVSGNQPEGPEGGQAPTPDIRAVGINTFPVPAGFCSANPSFIWVFAINTWERQSHLVPVIHQVSLDIDQDGSVDFFVFNFDLSLSPAVSDGRQLTWAQDANTNAASAFFFAEHAMNTGNTVLIICGEQVGLTGTDMLSTNVDIRVDTFDFYFGGPGDSVTGLTVTPLGEQYFGIPPDIPAGATDTMTVVDFGLFPGNTPELGIMLNTMGDRGPGARGGATQDTEAKLFTIP